MYMERYSGHEPVDLDLEAVAEEMLVVYLLLPHHVPPNFPPNT